MFVSNQLPKLQVVLWKDFEDAWPCLYHFIAYPQSFENFIFDQIESNLLDTVSGLYWAIFVLHKILTRGPDGPEALTWSA